MDGIRETDVDARGEVGGAVDESPSLRWRLWYLSKEGRWLYRQLKWGEGGR